MKGQISRLSHTDDPRASALQHQQGRVITDADLNEAALIARDRLDRVGGDAIASGAPATGGAVGVQKEGPEGEDVTRRPFLREGVVYADGLRGVLRATRPGGFDARTPMALYALQADLPDPPEIKAGHGLVYVDVWHRPVFALEDPDLADPALQGVDTGFRTEVVAQIKTAPLAWLDEMGQTGGALPARGNATLDVRPLDDIETGNGCDPCAEEVRLDTRIGNGLLRIEVIAVRGPANAPTRIDIAWSSENGAECARADALPEGYDTDGYAYEHFSRTTELNRGVFATPGDAHRPDFRARVQAANAHPFVRRWDGYAEVTPKGGVGTSHGTGTVAEKDGTTITITLDTFAATLTLPADSRAVVAGDYWLVELREFAPVGEDFDGRIRVVSPTPLGIGHRYCPLFRLEDGAPVPLSDREYRRLTFPALSDMPADHVRFVNRCEKLYGPAASGARTVQDALDRLCRIDAGDIAFDNPCPDTYGEASTVADALSELCDLADRDDSRWRRLVFDWGVICGLRVRLLKPGTIEVLPGTVLHWDGVVTTAPWDAPIQVGSGDIAFDDDWPSQAGHLCLGLERDGKRGARLVAGGRSTFRPGGPDTLLAAIAACKARPRPGIDKVLDGLRLTDKATMGKVLGVAVAGTWKSAGLQVTGAEAGIVDDFVEQMVVAHGTDGGSAEDVKTIRKALDKVERAYRVDDLPDGASKDSVRAERAAEKVAVLTRTSESFVNACKCAAIWPLCPEIGDRAPRVPLARIEIMRDRDVPAITRVCMIECRRQALTPRTMAYYLREIVDQSIVRAVAGKAVSYSGLDALERLCCPVPDSDDPGDKPGGAFTYIPDDYVYGVAGEQLPRHRYEIEGEALDVAREMLLGNGIDIVEELDITGTPGLDRIGEIIAAGSIDDRVAGKELVQPGDSVALLKDADGRAAGYLVVSRGQGRYAFPAPVDTDAAAGGTIAGGALDLDAAEGRLGELRAGLEAITGDLAAVDGKIGQTQSALSALDPVLGTTGQKLAAIGADRDALLHSVGGLENTVAGIARQLDKAETAVAAFEGLGTIDTDMDAAADRLAALTASAATLGGTLNGLSGQLAAVTSGLGTAQSGLSELTGLMSEAQAATETVSDLSGTLSALSRSAEGVTSQIAAAQAQIATLNTARMDAEAAFNARLSDLGKTLQVRQNDLAATESALAKATADRTAALEAARADLAEVESAVSSGRETMAGLTEELGALREDRDTIIAALRAERPVDALRNVPAGTREKLRKAGIFTVGDLTRATDGDTGGLREAGLKTTQINNLRKTAGNFLKP